ncbi:MAG: NAD(P)H-dependent oxidoreductase [Pararhodobacter sp.]|nr:NAD(P)H-dependent oxidoreductase [Pararhodobacter sp.]
MAELVLLGLCGSLRAASLNRVLMQAAVREFGGRFVEGDLRLPLYDGDLEQAGMPEAVLRLAGRIAAADAILIACPEYNKAPPGVLKNALDWISRVKPNPLWGKPVAIVSATAGRAGGERTQTMLRAMLAPHRVRALGWPEVLVGNAGSEFDAEGRLANDRYAAALRALMGRLQTVAAAA